MDYDAPGLPSSKPGDQNKRPYFYALLKQIAPLVKLPHISDYFIKGFSESKDIELDGTQDEYYFLLDLYRNQIIHPQNVDFIAQYAQYISNQGIVDIIRQYYQYGPVGGQTKLLTTAKFTTSQDKPQLFPETTKPFSQSMQKTPSASILPNQNISSAPIPLDQNIHLPAPNVSSSNTTHQPEHSEPKPDPGSVEQAGIFIYPLQRDTPRGICVIINNEKFSPSPHQLKDRNGSSTDRRLLIETFTNLRYDVRPYDDLDSGELMGILNGISQLDHSHFDSFICCMLTHGYADNVFASDSKEIDLREIYHIFQAKNCPTLGAKPKIFIIQACRGYESDPGTQGLTDGDEDIDPQERELPPLSFTDLPINSDFLIAYGTVYGYVSWRHPEQGTWFINLLCNRLDKMHNQTNLMGILTMVNNDLAQKKTALGKKQIAAPVNQLRGLFYFNPLPKGSVPFMHS